MKKIILFILFLLVVSISYAEVAESNDIKIPFTLKPAMNSDSNDINVQAVINPTARNDTKGVLFVKKAVAVFSKFIGGSTTQRQKRIAATLYYDVIVDVKKKRNRPFDLIKAEITIINKGFIPDRDGILITYMVDPEGNIHREKKMEFELIPPTCREGQYDPFDDVCILSFNETIPAEKNIIKVNATLPDNPIRGEWRFVALYETRVQPLIEAYDWFDVISYKNLIWMLMLFVVVGFIYFSWQYEKKQIDRKSKRLQILINKGSSSHQFTRRQI